MTPRTLRAAVVALLVVATALGLFAVTLRLQLDPNVASLLPEKGEAASLRRYVAGFGGGDLAVVAVEGPDAERNAAAAARIAKELSGKSSVTRASDRIDTGSRTLEPMLIWRHAGPDGRARLAKALTDEQMAVRLRETRALLLAPGSGSGELADLITRDPLRLTQLVFGSEDGSAPAGVRTQPDGAFATDDGKMALVMVKPRGASLRGDDARAFVSDVNSVLQPLRQENPDMQFGLTGGHAIAAATEAMLQDDLTISGTVAMLLASAAFILVFRRVRALLAVMPPLLLGTIWTASLATFFPGGLSGIAVAFMSVVVGVGVDTGVHVYAALLEARRAGQPPKEAARTARRETARPVLVAALTAGAAFGALALSEISAIRQLGILCGAGEVLTAIAIVLVTPEVGARLETKPPPPPPPTGWTRRVASLTRSPGRAGLVLALVAFVPVAAMVGWGAPSLSESLIAVRPAGLEPLVVQQRVFDAFGGKTGQWVVLVADPSIDNARARADKLSEALVGLGDAVEAVDALTALAPAQATQLARFDERDALDLKARADALEAELKRQEFATEPFEEALAAMRAAPRETVSLDAMRDGPAAILLDRYLGEDEGDHLVALYIRPSDELAAQSRIEEAIRQTDPQAMVTGYARLEATLRDSLSRDLPRIGMVAGALVLLALALALRRPRDIALALAVVATEICAVLMLTKLLGIPLHAYDVLVLPVLLGITVDEAMFLLYRARRSEGDGDEDIVGTTLETEGPPVAATALTTAAGFGALVACDFDGLADLGAVGSLGSIVGLIAALLIVPAGITLLRAASQHRARG